MNVKRLTEAALAAALFLPSAASSAELALGRHIFQFRDGGSAIYYQTGDGSPATETIVFMYGGTGCYSWKTVLPGIARDMGIDARYVALNKRAVSDDEASVSDCSPGFDQQNHPRQWMADYMEFLSAQLADKPGRAKNIVLLGISEGGALAARVARSRTDITHLVVIGDGGWSMRDNLTHLLGREVVEAAWRNMAADPNSLDRTWLGHPYRYWFDILDQEPMQDYLALDIPVLIGMGERDASVPVHSAVSVRRAAERAGKRNIGVVVYPGADHSLNAEGHAHRAEFLRGAAAGISAGDLD